MDNFAGQIANNQAIANIISQSIPPTSTLYAQVLQFGEECAKEGYNLGFGVGYASTK